MPLGDQRVPWVAPARDAGNNKPIRLNCGHILQRVNCHVDVAVRQLRLNFAAKQPLAADFVQGPPQFPVSPRRYRNDFNLPVIQSMGANQQPANNFRLHQGES